mmetsp:Transcript_11669/g.18834  ORF Transcript_11669/g.18834 Transcript_11669/m.18834 type:complete len:268 (+) Transcript_11669:124-927(+)
MYRFFVIYILICFHFVLPLLIIFLMSNSVHIRSRVIYIMSSIHAVDSIHSRLFLLLFGFFLLLGFERQIFGIITLKPLHFCFMHTIIHHRLKRNQVRTNPIQKIPIVRDHHRCATECLHTLFQFAYCIHIQIIGRFIQQQHIASISQRFRQMHSIPLTARQEPNQFLLRLTAEIKLRDILSRSHLLLLVDDNWFVHVMTTQYLLPNHILPFQLLSRLVNISQLHSICNVHCARSRCQFTYHQLEQRRLADSIRPNYSYDHSRAQRKR